MNMASFILAPPGPDRKLRLPPGVNPVPPKWLNIAPGEPSCQPVSPLGVKPVLIQDSFGVRPVRRVPSNPPSPDGPSSMAGLRGPFRREPKDDQPGACAIPEWCSAGLVRLDRPGRVCLPPSLTALPLKERSNGFGSES